MCAVSFFFSSRRRHTRLQGDWSSDVCSSDLEQARMLDLDAAVEHRIEPVLPCQRIRLEVPDADLLPQHLRADVDRIPGDRQRSEERRVGKGRRARGAQARNRNITDEATWRDA